MATAIGKLVPTAIVAAVLAWGCWPYLVGPRSGAGVEEDDNLLQIAQSLLSPAIQPAVDRNPFQPLDRNHGNQTVAVPSEEPATPGAAQGSPPPERDLTEILSSLVLDATYLQGKRRVAMINGRVYDRGEPLAISGSMTKPCIVARISAHKVLIQQRGRTVELTYRDPALKAKPSKVGNQHHE